MRKFLMAIAILIVTAGTAQSQITKKLGKGLKKIATEKVEDQKGQDPQSRSLPTNVKSIPKATKTLYVNVAKGSNRNDGSSPAQAFKDIQKAVDEAPDGAEIRVAEGNYEGKLGAGYISVKKYVSIIGGYNADFTQRDVIKYRTMVRPGPATSGTNANYGLFDIYVRGNRDGIVLIDGFILDKGDVNCYFLPDPENGKSGTPEGCETGRLDPPAYGSTGAPKMEDRVTVSNQLIHGDVEGQVTIRNNILMNGSHFGIQMGNIGGHFDIYNNIFLANRMAACEVRSMNQHPGEATVDFHNNTVMFVWRRDPMPGMKDMGYGFRYMTGIDANVHNNIFGCIDYAGLDRTYIDANSQKEAQRKTSAWDNLFFNNIEADLVMPSGGGKFLRVFSRDFEDVDQLIKYEGNQEISKAQAEELFKSVDRAYLTGFLNMDGTSAMEHNPHSSENILRSALGMNMRGTSSYTVSMYMNRYPLEQAPRLFGALKGYGAQIPVK